MQTHMPPIKCPKGITPTHDHPLKMALGGMAVEKKTTGLIVMVLLGLLDDNSIMCVFFLKKLYVCLICVWMYVSVGIRMPWHTYGIQKTSSGAGLGPSSCLRQSFLLFAVVFPR